MRCTLMHKDHAVLEMELDDITGGILKIGSLHAPERVPVGVSVNYSSVDRADLSHWWQSRSIPVGRSGLRDTLEQLGACTPLALPLKSCGLSLTDQYWIRPGTQDLSWSRVNYFGNPFSEDMGDILLGRHRSSQAKDLASPDNTTNGVLPKRWKIIDGTRCLLKGGTRPWRQEPFNEVFAAHIMERLGIYHVPYHLLWVEDNPYSVCPVFTTPQTEYVSAAFISKTLPRRPGESKDIHYQRCCDALSIPGAREQIDKMLTVDFLLVNEDRHMGNFGAIRDVETLRWIGAAPIFDCGASLWHNTLLRQGSPGFEARSKPFAATHDAQIAMVHSFDWLDTDTLLGSTDALSDHLAQSHRLIDDTRISMICEGFAAN